MRFKASSPYIKINNVDVSSEVRQISLGQDTAGDHRVRLAISPETKRNRLESIVFGLTGGRADIVFRAKKSPPGPENPEYRGWFMLSRHLPAGLETVEGAFSMDLDSNIKTRTHEDGVYK